MFSWPIPLLLCISVTVAWCSSVLRAIYSKKLVTTTRGVWFFNCLQNLLGCVTIAAIFLLSGGLGTFSAVSLVTGALMGIANTFSVYGSLRAIAIGPFSYSSVIISLSGIIPALSGLLFGETISLTQCIGIVLMAVCIILSPAKSDDKETKAASVKWLLLCAVAIIGSGSIGLSQKFHQSSSQSRGEWAAFLLSGFVVSVLLSAVFMCLSKDKATKSAEESMEKWRGYMWVFPLVVGIFFGFQHSINLFLVGKLEAIVVFPLLNLLPMTLSITTGFLLFKERLSLKRTVGLLVGIASCILLSGLF